MRYFIELSYLGKNYHGWQIQPNATTVQEKINKAFSLILCSPVLVVGAGRTDTGVHAAQMFAHIDTNIRIDSPKYIYKFNSVLPNDIVIESIFPVNNEAHVRFSATSRSYEYKIYLGRNPFLLDTTWQFFRNELNISQMNTAAELLKSYTNFKCFSKSKTEVKTYNCNITNAEWVQEGNILTFYITADRFLRNMVRAVVGTLVAIGQQKNTIEDLIEIIESQNRSMAGTSAPAQGLSLTAVNYPETIKHE
ncbi:tRNA pseudouridine(38-40) synthase TruA [Flavicella sp.]|uniref:tRNA pseudouridine(38-40) synthase TruA n=1 Tax=Flavicella sp. TaxID=2957742 RepID=UPI00301A44F7